MQFGHSRAGTGCLCSIRNYLRQGVYLPIVSLMSGKLVLTISWEFSQSYWVLISWVLSSSPKGISGSCLSFITACSWVLRFSKTLGACTQQLYSTILKDWGWRLLTFTMFCWSSSWTPDSQINYSSKFGG